MINPAKPNEELSEALTILKQEHATLKESYAAYVALSGQKEEILKKSEERFRSLFEGAPDAIILADPVTGVILDANIAACQLLFRPADEIIGMAQHELHPAQSVKYSEESFKRHVNELKEFGFTQPVENLVLRSDGTTIPVEVLAKMICLKDQDFLMGTFRDITERKHAEKILAESNEKLRNILDNTRDVIWSSSWPDLKVQFISSSAEKVFGRPLSAFYENTGVWKEIVHPDDRHITEKALELLVKNGTTSRECRIIHPDGTISWIYEKSELIYNEQHQPVRVNGIATDITERKNAEQAIREREERYRILFRDSPDAYLIISEGIFIDCNRATEAMLRGDRTQIIGNTPEALSPLYQPDGKSSRDAAEARINEALAQGKASFEWEHRRLDDMPLFVDVSVAAMMMDGKQVLFTTWRDISERKAAEKELIKLRNAIDRSGEAVFMTDKDGIFTFVNPGFTATFGYTATEVVGKATPFILYGITPTEEQTKRTMQALLDGNELSGERKSRKKDGTIIEMEGSVNAFFDENKKITGFLGIQRDITLKKHAEATFRDIIEKNPMSIQILNMEGYTIQTNPAHTRLFLAKPPKDYSIFKDSQLLDQGLGELFQRIRNGEVVYFPDSHFNVHDVDPSFPDAFAWVKTIGFALNDNSGVPERIVLMQENITDRKHVEAMFQDIIDKNPMSIQIVDKDGCTINGNPSYTRLFGALPPPDFSIFDDLSNKSPELEKLISRAKSGEVVHLPDLYYNPRDLSPDFPDMPLWIRALIFPLKDINGKPERFVFMHENITERKQAEFELIIAKERAEESDRLKSAFLANMSHEIRTPMNGILGFAGLLKSPDLTGDQQQEYLEIIKKSGDRMLNIINDIIDISKIEAGLMKIDVEESNINEQTEYIYTFFKPEVEAKGMRLLFRNTLPAKEAIIKTDREKVFAILTNLVKNAIKYTNSGSIEFGYELVNPPLVEPGNSPPAVLQFYVKDTGIGIPKDRQAAVFERFVQADITGKNAFQGAGLGLSITRAYVEMLGGRIWVESNPENDQEMPGSIFYFTLPYNALPAMPNDLENKAAMTDLENKTGKLKILIAEDDEISARLLSVLVREISREVLMADSGLETIEVFRNNPDTDLILMDIQMPDLNGYEATRKIRQMNEEVIIIAQTAFAQAGDREKSIAAGCNDYISKPISKDHLFSLINKHFGNK